MTLFDGLPGIFTGTFGQTVMINPQRGYPFSVQAIIRRRPEIDLAAGSGQSINQVTMSLSSADAESIRDGDEVWSNDQRYLCRSREVDGLGMTQIMLEAT